MKADFLLYWALIAISLFNTIVLFWLGFTVILNAEKRNAGIWLATTGLLVGGVFFATHTAMLNYPLDVLVVGVRTWWYFFFAPIVVLPYGWYLLMLWYAGFWDDKGSTLRIRHRRGLVFTSILVVALIALLLIANPFAFDRQSTLVRDLIRMGVRLFPIAALLYPVYIFSCMGLAMDALHRPAPSGRMMGDLARRRARPWLLAASLIQLIISLIVGGALAWLIFAFRNWPLGRIVNDGAQWADGFDFVLVSLVALTITLTGKAIVSYEIFTGKTLPRRGFLRQWRGVVTLSLLFSLLIGWCIVVELEPIFSLLILVILISGTFALLSWRFFRERDLATAQLRPFVGSQHLYDRVLSSETADGRADAQTMFHVLCASILETKGARLIPMGALSPLAGEPLVYPDEFQAPIPAADWPLDHQASCSTVETATGRAWLVPLFAAKSESTLHGMLVIADKWNGGLYTEEEIEVARAGGERLLDALAGAALASRLMELQRRRLSEIQVADHQTRRALHDEVLPRLHTAMLLSSGNEAERAEAQQLLATVHKEISSLLRSMPSALAPPVAQLGLIGALGKIIEEEFAQEFDSVQWEIAPDAEVLLRELSPLVAEVLFHAAREAMRNAAKYARAETEALHLTVSAQSDDGVLLSIEDNGIGAAEYTRAQAAEGGHGLALHSTMMAVIGGSLAVERVAPRGTRVTLNLPNTARR